MNFIKVKFNKIFSKVLKLGENVESIVCMCVSKNKKYLAISERIKNDAYPQLSIYNIKNA